MGNPVENYELLDYLAVSPIVNSDKKFQILLVTYDKTELGKLRHTLLTGEHGWGIGYAHRVVRKILEQDKVDTNRRKW